MPKCRHCNGDGMDPYTDYILECEHCEGSGWVGITPASYVSVPGTPPSQPAEEER